MEIIKNLKEFIPLKSSVLTIGSYDGLHRGHLKILQSVVQYAKKNNSPSVLVTFDPHPKHIIAIEKKEKIQLIMSFNRKIEIIKTLGINYVFIITFTKEFSKISPDTFLDHTIIPFFNPEIMVVGFDHHFGRKREGNPLFLKKYCFLNNIKLEIAEPVKDNNAKISSSRIRDFIKNGMIKKANFELGSNFGFSSKVIHGAGRGADLGFPTANLLPLDNKQILPKIGVYLIKGRINGQNTYGMCNLGVRPTFNETDFVIEVHFFFDDLNNLYDEELRIEFLERIRDELKFSSSKELTFQLNRDKQVCLGLQGKYE